MTRQGEDKPNAGPATRSDIEFHYDVGDDFYRLWLDSDMNYSAALWEGTRDLEVAQRRKNAFHLEAVDVRNANRILDVGCGWGALLNAANTDSPETQLVGLTLSPTQQSHCKALLPDAEILLESWEEHAADHPYDAIVCVGALEHFANHRMSREDRIARYAAFFDFCRRALSRNGRMSLQTIGYGNLPGGRLSSFIYERIFPNSDLPFLEELTAAAHGTLEVVGLRNDRLDYARTCSAWAERLCSRVEQAIAVTNDPGLVEDYVRYLKMSAAAFRQGALALYRVQLVPYVNI